MTTALVRPPGPALARCALTYLDRDAIDAGLALAQHRAYAAALADAGLAVELLQVLEDAPDACFVEDPAVYVGQRMEFRITRLERGRGKSANILRKIATICAGSATPSRASSQGRRGNSQATR